MSNTGFPGGSKSRVNRAGNNIRTDDQSLADLVVINEWRAAHKVVLNAFQSSLRKRTKDTGIIVAQRHKRRSTIFNKLLRFPSMNLSRMDDVAGIRLIFDSVDELYDFRRKFHKARFKHQLRNSVDKYDYIKKPKKNGYRGVHDIYEYRTDSDSNSMCNGLLVEIQYRTKIQHAWATAVEILGFITENQPKFDQGDQRYIRVMTLASEIIANSYENMSGPLGKLPKNELIREFLQLWRDLNLTNKFVSADAAFQFSEYKKNIILIFNTNADGKSKIEIEDFRVENDAMKRLFELEAELPEADIVLVKAHNSNDIRQVYKNYFGDSKDFVSLTLDGAGKLVSQLEKQATKKKVTKKKAAAKTEVK